MSDDIRLSVVKRTIELLGGVERTRQMSSDELNGMNARWQQDVEVIGRILRSHLYIEHYMTEYLEKTNPNLGKVQDARLSFAQKVALLDPNDFRLGEVIEGVKRLNAIRNRLAHRLNASVTQEDAAVFLQAKYFEAIRTELAKPNSPSQDPLDILEEFAKYASYAFTNKFSEVDRALKQAMDECGEKSIT